MNLPVTRLLLVFLLAILASASLQGADLVSRVLSLPPSADNPRNSEGDFIRLKDGRILLVYTHFISGAADHATAYLAGRISEDGGQTWTDRDLLVLANEAKQNVMSVSLLRLQDGRIALFYARKNSNEDCRPCVRFSEDEAQTWSEPVLCIPDAELGYYVLNNDRVIQLRNGRLVMPVAQHHGIGWPKWTGQGTALCYFSDDGGRTWKRGQSELDGRVSDERRVTIQEPGVVELTDRRLLMFCRTNAGCQYISHSKDGGDHWTPLVPSTLLSPISPASIERIPSTGDLLLVWNNHDGIEPSLKGKRTPLSVAVSHDEGQTWQHVQNIETNPHGWFCYTAIDFVDDQVLLAYCAGDRRENNGLALLQVSRLPVGALEGDD